MVLNENEKIKILIPVFDDWEVLKILFEEFSILKNEYFYKNIFFVLINDGTIGPEFLFQKINENEIEIIHLNRNVGHQKAIAIGLSYIYQKNDIDKVIVMDADGEDKPVDILSLLNASTENPDKIIFASRSKRQEGLIFKLFYKIYKIIFIVLSGKRISFGNFSLIPFTKLKRLVYVSEIWNHYSGGVLRSKLPYAFIPLERGKRLAGKSKMSFTTSVLHGLSAISVYLDTASVRLLIFSLIMVLTAISGVFVVMSIKFFTHLAIPGWASFVVLGLTIIFMQACLISLFLTFIVLTYRTQKHFIPALDYKDFIDTIEIL